MAKSITPPDLQTLLATDEPYPVLLFDVRRRPAFEAAPDRMTGSSWRDPSEVSAWDAELSREVPVVVYCVHGHEVSQGVAERLQATGVDAAYLEGGIEGWREAGGEVEPRVL